MSKKPALSILIPVTKNEAPCLPDTLDSIRKEASALRKLCEIVVIANCCKGITDEIALRIFSSDEYSKNKFIASKVINCEIPGKMFAVNVGIDVAHG